MPLVDDFSYKLGDTGIILNPNSQVLPFVDITKIEGLDNAPIRTTERDHEGTDGGFMDAEYEKGRHISIEGTVYSSGSSAESFLDSLKSNWAPSRVSVPLYFKKPGVDERVIWVKPLGCQYDINAMRRIGCTEIRFTAYAEDPRIYTSTLRSKTITQTVTSSVGRAYNRGYDYGYAFVGAPDGANLTNLGNRPTPTRLTVTGPDVVINPQVINDTLGITMRLEIVIPVGSALVIDTYSHTILLDGQNRRKALIQPDWFLLEPGDNFLRFRSETPIAAALNAQYYDAWR